MFRTICALSMVLGVTLFCASSVCHAEEHDKPAGAAGHAAGDHKHVHIGAEGANTNPLELRADTAVYTLVIFIVLAMTLAGTAWKPVVSGLDKRESALHADVLAAKQARDESERLLAEHSRRLDKVQEEVREIVAEARRDADHLKDEILAKANKDAELAKQRAVNDINQARDTALNQLFDHMADAVAAAAQTVVGRSLTGADQERLIRESLTDLTKNVN